MKEETVRPRTPIGNPGARSRFGVISCDVMTSRWQGLVAVLLLCGSGACGGTAPRRAPTPADDDASGAGGGRSTDAARPSMPSPAADGGAAHIASADGPLPTAVDARGEVPSGSTPPDARAAGDGPKGTIPGWEDVDTYMAKPPGGAEQNGDVISVTGAGEQIAGYGMTGFAIEHGGHPDSQNYLFKRVTGDGEITAFVADSRGECPRASWAAVQFRQEPTGDAIYAAMLLSPADGRHVAFSRRLVRGMPTPALIQGPEAKPPLWLRVTRRGNHFTGSYSTDGKTWTVLGMDDVPLTGEVTVGLVATSAEQTRLCTIDYQHVTVTP